VIKVFGRDAEIIPIPENDIWIAALSFQHHIKLACRDKHFEHIDGLDYEMW